MAMCLKISDYGFSIEAHNGKYVAIVGSESSGSFDNLMDAVDWVEAKRQIESGASDG